MTQIDRAALPEQFGEALEELERIVGTLETDEDLQLEEVLALYERGLTLAGTCRQRLAAAELKLVEVPPASDE